MKTVEEISGFLKDLGIIPTSDKIEYLDKLLLQADWQGYNRGFEECGPPLGKRHLRGVRRGFGNATGLWLFHVERIGGHQPYFHLRRAVAAGHDHADDALDVCAAPTLVSVCGDADLRLDCDHSSKFDSRCFGH